MAFVRAGLDRIAQQTQEDIKSAKLLWDSLETPSVLGPINPEMGFLDGAIRYARRGMLVLDIATTVGARSAGCKIRSNMRSDARAGVSVVTGDMEYGQSAEEYRKTVKILRESEQNQWRNTQPGAQADL